EGAEARILHVVDEQLKLAARLVQPDSGAHEDLLAVPRRECREHISLSEHRAAHLRSRIFEREIPVSRGGPREIRDFRFEPEAAETALQQDPDLAIESRDTVDIPGRPGAGIERGRGVAWGYLHRPHDTAVYRTPGA